MTRVHRPALLVVGLIVAALAIWKAFVPGIFLLTVSDEVDHDVEESNKRSLPIMGTITDVSTEEGVTRRSRRYVSYEYHAEALVPGEIVPRRTSQTMLGREFIDSPGERPPTGPKRGDPVQLYYDPQDPGDLSGYTPVVGGPSVAWFSLVFLIPGAIALVIAGFLIRRSLRGPA